MHRFVNLAPLLWLSACGGGASDPYNQPLTAQVPLLATAGRVAPAEANLQVVELDARGRELQRATLTDESGQFSFSSPVSGERLEVRISQGALRADRLMSARLGASLGSLQITPITTWFDQLLLSDTGRANARETVGRLVLDNCGVDVLEKSRAMLTADAVKTDADLEWLLVASAAVDEALRQVGASADASQAAWVSALTDSPALIKTMCSISQAIYGPTWLQTTKVAINAQRPAADRLSEADLSPRRASLVQRVLALPASAFLRQYYPQAAELLGIRPEHWTGKEAEYATALAVADSKLDIDTSSTAAKADRFTSETSVAIAPPSRTNVFNRRGTLVTALSASIGLAPHQPAPTVRISNNSVQDGVVDLLLNGHRLKNIGDVVAEVLALPQLRLNEPLHERAWRYVHGMSEHQYGVSIGLFIHQPELYLRSLGVGLCDDTASVLHWIWQAMGYEARVDALIGHVVAEVLVNGRWQMYDADYQVYYYNRDLSVAGVRDLQLDPSLIYAPTNPVLPLSAPAYWPGIADIYANADGTHLPYAWYSTVNTQPLDGSLVVPRGGYVDIDAATAHATLSSEPSVLVDYPTIRSWLPPGYTGELRLYGVLADVTGVGQISIGEQTINITSAGIATRVAALYALAPDTGVREITINNVGDAGLTITVLANRKLFSASPRRLDVEIRAQDLTGMVMEVSRGSRR